ncbi:putative dehydrin DHN1 [Cocos nucifera]|uniref:Putative dehydrin DHN1 n=1 Tax=Cocos nucifera TaxID=13894 RepID=A0A8K0N2J7_COCNU|nr:putative dehydrin DHN1 [Cocos nucifera]
MASHQGMRDGYSSDIRRTEEHVGGNMRVIQEEHRSTTGADGHREEHHSITGMLHRSGSSSSSSVYKISLSLFYLYVSRMIRIMCHCHLNSILSEDDGQGGRRKKKGMMDKIKEKMPGGHHTKEHSHADCNVHHEAHHDHEKKGMMEKIMDKLPGHH